MGRPKSVKSAPVRPQIGQALAAFKKIKPRLAQLAADQVIAVNADVNTAVSLALAAVTNLRPLRDAITNELPKHPVEMLDDLEDFALTVWYAHLLVQNQDAGSEAPKKLMEEAAPLRESLLIGAEALAHRGLLDATRVAEIRSGHGHNDAANDLMALAALFRSSWERVKSKTAVEEAEVAKADELGTKLMLALGAKETNGSNKPGDAADRLARAYTLLSTAYDACRRAAAYLRWAQGDVDDLAPPLTRKTPGRKPGSTTKGKPSTSAGGLDEEVSDEIEDVSEVSLEA